MKIWLTPTPTCRETDDPVRWFKVEVNLEHQSSVDKNAESRRTLLNYFNCGLE